MKKLILTVCVAILFVAVSAHGTEYTSEANWNTAVSGLTVLTEDFLDASFDDFTIQSDWIDAGSTGGGGPGGISSGQWLDRVDTDDNGGVVWETTITFDETIYGFGGYWDLNGPTGPGEEIGLIINGSQEAYIPRTAAGVFYGVAGIGGFDTVVIRGLNNYTGYVETFTLDDAVYAVPVPGAVLLGMLGLSVAGVKLRKHA